MKEHGKRILVTAVSVLLCAAINIYPAASASAEEYPGELPQHYEEDETLISAPDPGTEAIPALDPAPVTEATPAFDPAPGTEATPAPDPAPVTEVTPTPGPEEGENPPPNVEVKDGLVQENGKLYCYKNGKMLRRRWITEGNYTYYFGSSGAACTENVRIAGTVYVFRLNGRLVQPAKSTFVKINKKKFYVNPQGQASTGSVTIGSKIYIFRKNGRLLQPKKTAFVTVGGRRYYVNTKGQACSGNVRIGDAVYVFDKDGSLLRQVRSGFATVGSSRYYVDSSGKIRTGWLVLGNDLYYASSSGAIWKNTTYEGIVFDGKGKAENNVSAQLKIKTMKIVGELTNTSMTSAQKLRACWNYVTAGGFVYLSKYPNLSRKGWQKETALDMLTTKRGNCYSFACAFAALAAEIGYQPRVVCGRITGTRDGVADGMTRHCWVTIDGRYYDPEGQYAGWFKDVYGAGTYYIDHKVQQTVDFRTSV